MVLDFIGCGRKSKRTGMSCEDQKAKEREMLQCHSATRGAELLLRGEQGTDSSNGIVSWGRSWEHC